MKPKILITVFLLSLPLLLLRAQENQNAALSLRYIRLDSLVNTLERVTSYKFYYSPQQTDTLLLSINLTDGSNPLLALKTALEKNGFALSNVDAHHIYITKGDPITTQLNSLFYARATQDEVPLVYQNEQLQKMLESKQILADSENKLYTLGDAQMADKPGNVKIMGYVRDHITGEPIAGINVFSEDKKWYAMSDTYGHYTLTLPRGYNTLLIQGFGYKDSHRSLRVFSDSDFDVSIEEEVFSLQGIVVSAEKMANVRDVQLGVEKVRADRIRHIPTAFGEADVIKVVLTLPGVKTVGEASGGFNVRGGATDQNLILFNEGTIYNPSHLFGLFSLFNNDVVNNIELYKSSIPARYGGRISSVLEVNSREGSKNKLTGSAGIGLLTTKVALEGPLAKDKTSFILAARTTYSDWLLKLIPEGNGYDDGKANFYDFNAGISHKFNEKNFLHINGYYSRDRFSFNKESSYMYQNANGSLKYRSVLSDRTTLVLAGAYDRYNYHTKDFSYAAAAYDMAFTLQQITGKLDLTTRLGEKHKLSYGLNAFYYLMNPGDYVPYGSESLVMPDHLQRERGVETALYLSDNWDITPKFSVEYGVRYNFYAALGDKKYYTYQEGAPKSMETVLDTVTVANGKIVKPYHGPEFRISARYAFTPSFSIKAGFNSMRQNIHMLSNTTVISPTDIWKLSDANIQPQTGWQAAMGLYKNFSNNTIECSIEGYYKNMDHYMDYAPAAELLMNHHIETDVIETQGKAYGVEFMVKKTLGRLNGWLSYTYSRTLLRQNDPTVLNPINNGEWYSAPYDKPHDVKLVGNYKFTHRVSLSVNVDYSTGRPMTMPMGTYFYAGGWRLLYTLRNANRIPDYFRMDIALNIEPSHKLTLLTHSSFTIGVYNVTGRKNPYSVFFRSDGINVNSYKLSVFGCPIPYVTYNIKF